MSKILLFVFFVLIAFSCSHIKSGSYVQLVNNGDLKRVSEAYNVPMWLIEKANPDKKFKKGEWIFVPTDTGFVSGFSNWGNSSSPSYYLESGDFLWPVPSSRNITSKYGKRWGRKHEGIDIAAKRGSHILASQSGVVVYSGREMGGYGNIAVVAHSGGFFTVYAHTHKLFVRKGDKVHRGEVIAQVGSTGRSTGPHLHFEIRHNSRSLNPLAYVSK